MSSLSKVNKIALGTVQFGIDYGVANQAGRVSTDAVKNILKYAQDSGIDVLDTAIAYGESERVLGESNIQNFSIVTKLPELPIQADPLFWVQNQLRGSLERLGVSCVDGLLLHRPGQLLQENGDVLYEQLLFLKQQGLVKRIGVSVYGPEELEQLSERFHFDLVQAPFSIVDQRMKHSGWLGRLQESGTALHVRSVFLQGLLLMSPASRPEKFSPWAQLWVEWENWLRETQQTALEACIRFAVDTPEIEKVVVGVDSLSQLEEIVLAADGESFALPHALHNEDSRLLNPACWSSL